MSAKQEILRMAIEEGYAHEEMTSIGIMDWDGLADTVASLHEAFPENFEHTFAVKANSLKSVLAKLVDCGLGAEVASPGELKMAQSAGFQAERIIFDSPAKTREDLRYCLENNLSFNLDNEQEFERVAALMPRFPNTKSIIGFRVNPQIGSGAISSTSTATHTSKFGFPLRDGDNYERLLSLYRNHSWLTSIHTHTGSQGCPLELMAQGIGEIIAIADTVNEGAQTQQVRRIDIGGGLPVNFASEIVKPTFREYADLLRKEVPQLFSGKYHVKTEFGRSIAAKNGFIITRVEYTKMSGGRHIATTHAGAQIMTRTAFLPASWPIRVEGFAPDGTPRTEEPVQTDVAGPCCFAADLVAKNILLPKLYPNDYVLIYDTGAYYFSNHFDYNSLPRVAVYSASHADDAITLELIRRAETLDEVVSNMS